MNYKVIIGCEVHVQLLTATKAFCSCKNVFGKTPNSLLCPVCAGLPGALPVANRKMIEYAIKAGLALNCTIASLTKFDRKNFIYPDMPKGYQISQFDMPICYNGYLEIQSDEGQKKIRIRRAHLEEDAGKNLHPEDGSGLSYVDLNRCGTPLIEIVSEPDLRSPEEAVRYVQGIKEIMEWLCVSDCNMEEGSLRCDANINLWIYEGDKKFATPIAEVKNVNSFKSLKAALSYEVKRQLKEWNEKRITLEEKGKTTRGFCEKSGTTLLQRHKEEASEYRYFPEPDLKPLYISTALVNEIKAQLPELPGAMRERFCRIYGLSEDVTAKLTSDRDFALYFENACKGYKGDPKHIANWLTGEVSSVLNQKGIRIRDFKVSPGHIRELIEIIDSGTISGKIAKSVFPEMVETGKAPVKIIEEKGLKQITDKKTLEKIVKTVIAENPGSAEDYRNGKSNAIKFLMGQVMKQTKGKANPGLALSLLEQWLKIPKGPGEDPGE